MKKKWLAVAMAALMVAGTAPVYAQEEQEELQIPVEQNADPQDNEAPELQILADPVEAVVSPDERTISLKAKGADAGASNVSFAVWSEVNGQDDLIWINAKKQADGTWTVDVPVKGHKNSGLYHIHCYQTVNSQMAYIGETAVEITQPSADITTSESEGGYKVTISNLDVPSGVKNILVPIWGEKDGQNDIVWHNAVKEGDDYVVNFTAGQHRYESGTYQIHCYLTDNNDIATFLGSTSYEVTFESSLKAEVSADGRSISVKATGIDPDATSVSFPIWSEANGQDDIVWAPASKQANGDWSADIPIRGHKNAGLYNIHCYYVARGTTAYFGDTTTNVPEPSAKVEAIDVDPEKGTFKVRIYDIDVPAGVKRVQVPIWSDVNGQNDIVWHQAVKDGDDYVVEVSAGQHKYETGTYQIHCYITDNNDITIFTNTAYEVTFKPSLAAALSADEKIINVTATGITTDADAVLIPVWSDANGQDDIVWVNASRAANGDWTAAVPVKGHKNTGLYHIHCYYRANGSLKYFDEASVTVTEDAAKLELTEEDPEQGTFTVTISEMNVISGVSKIAVAVWGDVNGQNDVVWYDAVKSGNDYIVKVAASNHKFENGTYSIHGYLTDGNGITTFLGNLTANVNLAPGVVVSVDADQNTARVGYIETNGATGIKAAVWSEAGGQDDLVWYNMAVAGNNAMVNVPIRSHKTAGIYKVHVYSDSGFLGEGTFTIDPVTVGSITVSDIDGKAGSFRVNISDVSSASGVEKIQVPVWPGNDQSKICWYTAQKASDGNYYVDVKVSNHKNTFGDYNIHVYAYGNNGVAGFGGGTTASIEADKYMYTEVTGQYSKRIWIVNPGENIVSVLFPTWSQTGGQDDIIWYNGTQSGNAWYVDVKSTSHKHGGKYTTTCYTTDSNGVTKADVNLITYDLMANNSNPQMYELAQGFSSDTQYLILVNRGLHRIAIYQGSRGNWKEIKYWPCVVGKPSTPTPTGTYKIKGRFDWFGEGHKCWWATQIEGYYYFHTVLYCWDNAPIKILDGTMDAAASAGCIRLDEPNARFIYTQIPRGTTVHIYN